MGPAAGVEEERVSKILEVGLDTIPAHSLLGFSNDDAVRTFVPDFDHDWGPGRDPVTAEQTKGLGFVTMGHDLRSLGLAFLIDFQAPDY